MFSVSVSTPADTRSLNDTPHTDSRKGAAVWPPIEAAVGVIAACIPVRVVYGSTWTRGRRDRADVVAGSGGGGRRGKTRMCRNGSGEEMARRTAT